MIQGNYYHARQQRTKLYPKRNHMTVIFRDVVKSTVSTLIHLMSCVPYRK